LNVVRNTLGIPPGQEFIFTMMRLEARSEPVVIQEIAPLRQDGDAARLTDVQLAPQDPESRFSMPEGVSLTDPPVWFRRDETSSGCAVQETAPVAGYELQPGDGGARISLRISVEQEGTWSVDGFAVRYEQDGQVFEEEVSLGITVRANASLGPQVLLRPEKRCLNLAEPLRGAEVR
jgi:hypothetical protein